MSDKVKIDISTGTLLKIALIILGVWFLYLIRDIVFLFFIVLVIVAALGPLVDRMSKYLPRILSMIILSLLFLGILTALGFLIIPPLIDQIKQIAINLPVFASSFGPIYQNLQRLFVSYQENLFNIASQLGRITLGLYSTTIGLISGFIAVFTILILAFYMLLEQDSLKKFLEQTLPIEHKEKFFEIVKKISNKMGSWLRGQALLMLVIGILDGIALVILGVPYALTLAVWGGLTEVVPYIGPWLGLIPAVIISFVISPIKALLVLTAYIVIQQLEANFLAPKVMGRAVGLSPVIIILALIIGAKLMGILGVIVSVPIAAVISVVIQELPTIRRIRENS